MLGTQFVLAAMAILFLSSACGSNAKNGEQSSAILASSDHMCRYEEAPSSFSEGLSVKVKFDQELRTGVMETIISGKTGSSGIKPQTVRTTLRLVAVVSSSPLTTLYQSDEDGTFVSFKASVVNHHVSLGRVEFKKGNVSSTFFIECD